MSLLNNKLSNLPFKSLNDGSSDWWTASGSGTNEYFYNQTDLPFNPLVLLENGSAMTYVADGMGSLNAGEWTFGDNDSIGDPRVYVRLTDNTDPDSKSADFLLASEFKTIVTAPGATETISLSIIVANNETTDVDIVLVIADSSDIAQAVWLFTIGSTDGPLSIPEKIILNPTEKLRIMANKELVNIICSQDQS